MVHINQSIFILEKGGNIQYQNPIWTCSTILFDSGIHFHINIAFECFQLHAADNYVSKFKLQNYKLQQSNLDHFTNAFADILLQAIFLFKLFAKSHIMVNILQIYISCSHTMIDSFTILVPVPVPALQPTVLFLTVLFAIFLRAKWLQILGKGCRRIWHTSAVCIYYGSPPCSEIIIVKQFACIMALLYAQNYYC